METLELNNTVTKLKAQCMDLSTEWTVQERTSELEDRSIETAYSEQERKQTKNSATETSGAT